MPDLADPLLPSLSVVNAAIAANTRERKRLFALRKLIEQTEKSESDTASTPVVRQPAKLHAAGS